MHRVYLSLIVRVKVSSSLRCCSLLLRVVMHRVVDQPLINKVEEEFSSSLRCCSLALFLRMVMHRVDHPLIGKVNVSSSLRGGFLSSCTW